MDGPHNVAPGTTIDFVADIEIDGQQVLNRRYNPSSAGDNTLIAAGATERLKIYKVMISVNTDMTGEAYVKIGSTQLGGVLNPKAGGQYALVNCFPDYELGALGDDLVVNLGQAISCIVNVGYEVV